MGVSVFDWEEFFLKISTKNQYNLLKEHKDWKEYMWLLMIFISCGETEQEEQERTCVEWEDSCGGCTWMCTDESEKPDVVCDIECTEPHPQEECVLLDDNTCAFQ